MKPSLLNKYFNNQIVEIANDVALRMYGAFIAMAYVITFVNWIVYKVVPELVSKRICWPFFEDCFKYNNFTAGQIQATLYVLGFLATMGAVLFLIPRYYKLAFWWLVGIFVVCIAIYIQDFQLRSNQVTILLWVSSIYLFWPNKRNCLRYLIVTLYFCASLLKYNNQWMAGNYLYGPPLGIPENLIPAACVYVIVLESCLVFGLLARNKWIFWGVFLQVILFHIVSWPVVGFYYPTLMFAILAIFPLTYFLKEKEQKSGLIFSFWRGLQPISTYLCVIVLLMLQCLRMTFPGDVRTTSEGRLVALDMFDSLTQCRGELTLKFQDGQSTLIPIPLQYLPVRFKCDPVVYFSLAKQECWKNKNIPGFLDLDLHYTAWQINGYSTKPLVYVEDFCSKDLHYNILKTNDWIIKEPRRHELHVYENIPHPKYN